MKAAHTSEHSSKHEGDGLFVLGLGLTGQSVVQAALAEQIQVSVWDDSPTQRESLSENLKSTNTKSANTKGANTKDTDTKDTNTKDINTKDINKVTFADESQWEAILSATTRLVISPGIPYEGAQAHPLIHLARAQGVTPISDLELFFHGINPNATNKPNHKVIAITGTDGKSTTATLTEALLQAAGKQAVACGNLSPAIFAAEITPESTLVLEMSSYQIPITPSLTPDAAVLVSLAPDHLDRHGSLENYLEAKRGIFAQASIAIIGVDDPLSRAEYQRLVADNSAFTGKEVIAVSGILPPQTTDQWQEQGQGQIQIKVGVQGNSLIDEQGTVCAFPNTTSFASPHNRLNVAAAWTAVRELGVARDCVALALHNFQGLPHRFATVAEVEGIRFINDSKATNIHATIAALQGATSNKAVKVFWIAGGQGKQQDFTTLFAALPDSVERGFFIGEARQELTTHATKTRGASFAQNCEGGLEQAVSAATQAAQELCRQTGTQAIVLLSPACASFDQFANFSERGRQFITLVQALTQQGGQESNP